MVDVGAGRDGSIRVSLVGCTSDLAVKDIHIGVLQHVAVFARAEHRTHDEGLLAFGFGDVHLGLFHLTHLLVW